MQHDRTIPLVASLCAMCVCVCVCMYVLNFMSMSMMMMVGCIFFLMGHVTYRSLGTYLTQGTSIRTSRIARNKTFDHLGLLQYQGDLVERFYPILILFV